MKNSTVLCIFLEYGNLTLSTISMAYINIYQVISDHKILWPCCIFNMVPWVL